MAKRSGSKTSRSERRAGRDRAARARERGLPERREEPVPSSAYTPEPRDDRDGDEPSSVVPLRAAKPAGIPMVVKVVGGALLVLAAAYVLTHFRDAPSSGAGEPAPSASPEPSPRANELPASVESEAPPVESVERAVEAPPAASVVPPEAPRSSAPVVSAPSKPKVGRTPMAGPTPPATPAVAPPAPARPTTPVAAPAAPSPLSPPPVDNPY